MVPIVKWNKAKKCSRSAWSEFYAALRAGHVSWREQPPRLVVPPRSQGHPVPPSLSHSDRGLALDVKIPVMVPDSARKTFPWASSCSAGCVWRGWKSGWHNQKATNSSRNNTKINGITNGVRIQKELWKGWKILETVYVFTVSRGSGSIERNHCKSWRRKDLFHDNCFIQTTYMLFIKWPWILSSESETPSFKAERCADALGWTIGHCHFFRSKTVKYWQLHCLT